MDTKQNPPERFPEKNNPFWHQGDELLFTSPHPLHYAGENYHYECFSDGIMECDSSQELAGDSEKENLLHQIIKSRG